MKIRIGENIRRLRKAKGLTQEQLAELMNVSCAAVSKWESSDTYPDITLIFPLANLFSVTVDELMGYDEERIETEITKAIEDYRQLQYEGKFKEADNCIAVAYREYPNDYRVMNLYMWNVVGGSADNNPELLITRRDELMRICDCILGGCTDEGLRLESMTMKAKLLHASGDTQSALSVLSAFPSFYQSSGQKAEQLFAKNSIEFKYWARRNLYELAVFCADKAAKVIFFDDSADLSEKVRRGEGLADSVAGLYKEINEAFLCLMAKSIYGRLANDLTFCSGETSDIIRIRNKYLALVKEITALSARDSVLLDFIKYEHNTDNLLEWTLKYYLTTDNAPLAKLREYSAYTDMLKQYQ